MKKFQHSSINDPFNPEPRSSHQIATIPLYRKHIQHGAQAQKEAVIYGYKYFSRVSAVGESTIKTLRAISRCSSSKMIHKFQFDPYLCEKSCLKDLRKVFRKMKCLRNLNVVFRRLDGTNETDIVVPFLMRQIRLKKFRFEFPKTNSLNEKGIENFAKILGSLSIKYLELAIVDLENLKDAAYQFLPKYGQKNIHLEEIDVISKRLAKFNVQEPAFIQPNRSSRPNLRLKKAAFSVGINTGWFSENMEADNHPIMEMGNMSSLCNLESLRIRCSGVFSTDEFFGFFAENLPFLAKLTSFAIEFLKSRISDFELITLIQIVSKAPQIENFTLKVIQHPNISKDCIFYLLKMLLKFPNLKKFDLYFRRLNFDDEELHELIGNISQLTDVKCVCFKTESLHIFRSNENI